MEKAGLDAASPSAKARRALKTSAPSAGSVARSTAVIGVVLAFLIPVLPVQTPAYRLVVNLVGSEVVGWGLVQLTLELSVVVLMPILFAFVQGQDARLLVRAREGRIPADLCLGLGAFVLVALVSLAKGSPGTVSRPSPRSDWIVASPRSLTPFALPLPLRVAVSVVNGISEELGCRAYAILTLESFGVPALWTALICWAGSVAIHIPAYGLRRQVILAQLIFVLLYEFRRSLVASAWSHMLADGFALIVWERLGTIF